MNTNQHFVVQKFVLYVFVCQCINDYKINCIDLLDIYISVLQCQVIHCIKHTQNQLYNETCSLWIISLNIFPFQHWSHYEWTQSQYNTIQFTIKLWNDFKLKTQLHNCISNGLQLHSQSITSVLFHDSHHINSFIQKSYSISISISNNMSYWWSNCTLFKYFWLWSNCVFNNIKHQHTFIDWLIDWLIDWFRDWISLSHHITS
jgi:hypothetical protein